MRSKASLVLPVVVLLVGLAMVAIAQSRLAQIAAIYTPQPGEQIITQVAYPLAPWPQLSLVGVAVAAVGLVGMIALLIVRRVKLRQR